MAITTYAELKTAFGSDGWFYGRDLTTQIDEIIDLTEAYLNTKLRCRQMETSANLTPTSNVCTLPTDYLEAKRVVELASIRRRLDYITEDAADVLYPDRASGLASHYIIVGSSLTALPLSANVIELTYYQKVPALTDAAPTNWLLTAHPNLYLAACKMYAAEFTGNENGEIEKQAAFVGQFITNIHALENRAKFGNAGLTLRGNVP
jgi:hypothetical protein